MINTLIPLIDNENIKVTREEVFDKPNGAEGTRKVEIGIFKVSIQGIKSNIKVQGYVLDKNLDGSKINSAFICYSENVDIKVGDIITRINRDNFDYEVAATEAKGIGTILEQRVSIINRLDNQGGKNA